VPIVAVTRLRVRSIRFLPRLYWDARKIRRSLKKAPGFLGGKLLVDRKRAYWTITWWKDLDSMLAFRNSRVHTAVARMVYKWCDEASVVHWATKEDQLPTWEEAHRRMTEAGKLTRLRFQTADHIAHTFREPYWTKSREESLNPGSIRPSIAA
jgi:heme-degrading monooxygenase HmoA